MKRVLIYGNRKQDDDIWDVSTPELLEKACLELFNILNTVWQVYSDLFVVDKSGICVDCSGQGSILLKSGNYAYCPTCDGPKFYNTKREKQKKQELDLYNKAISGDAKAAYELLKLRKTYEYEEWNIYNVKN